MPEEPKRPRNIKDLKARLGRTVVSKGQPSSSPPGARPTPVPPARASSVPPPAGGMPGAAPGVAPPPFARPESSKPPSDPFASAGAQPAAQEVRLVVDEKPVADSEVGRKKKSLMYILLGAGLIVGLAAGWGLSF